VSLDVDRIYHNSSPINLHPIQDESACNSQDNASFILQVHAHQAFCYFSVTWPCWRVQFTVRYPSRYGGQIAIHRVLAVSFCMVPILYQPREVNDGPMHLVWAGALNAKSCITEVPECCRVSARRPFTEDSLSGLTCVRSLLG
jgi:hypothetical protein